MSTMIIVDDELLFLNHARKFINHYFPEIEIMECFESSREALDFTKEHIPDIIMTDISMPEMDGLTFAKEINEHFPQCVTIIVSSYSSFEYAQSAIHYNVFSYMVKPLDIDVIRPLMRKALQLSDSRKAQFRNNVSLVEEEREVFFTDLLSHLIVSEEKLCSKLQKLQIPLSLDKTCGGLVKISLTSPYELQNWQYDMDQLPVVFRNAINMACKTDTAYFARKTDYNFYFFVLGMDLSKHAIPVDNIVSFIDELLGTECLISLSKTFSSLKEFVPKDTVTVSKKDKAHSNKELILKAISYMEKNYNKDITRESVADTVYLSPSYFALQFKKETGKGFVDYLTEIRMKNAIELLATNMKVNDIIERVGYQSRSRFLLNFRNYTSYTPSEYRMIFLNMEDN